MEKAEEEKQQIRDEMNRAFTFEKLKLEHELTKLRLELRRKSSDSLSQPTAGLDDIEWSVVVPKEEGEGEQRPKRSSSRSRRLASTPKTPNVTPDSSSSIKGKPSPDAIFWGPSSVFQRK